MNIEKMKKLTTRQLNLMRKKITDVLGDRSKQNRNKQFNRLVGKYFKYRNCYSCPETEYDYWFIFIHVLYIRNGQIIVHEFQKDVHGKIIIELNKAYDFWLDDCVRSTKQEFRDEFDDIAQELMENSLLSPMEVS